MGICRLVTYVVKENMCAPACWAWRGFDMLRDLATLARLFQILKTLAREDALGHLQSQGSLAILVMTIKFIWGRKKSGRPEKSWPPP